jgi:hypothetical protein
MFASTKHGTAAIHSATSSSSQSANDFGNGRLSRKGCALRSTRRGCLLRNSAQTAIKVP